MATQEQHDVPNAPTNQPLHESHGFDTHASSNTASISASTSHALIIDAGSTGSRLHVFEYEPRIVSSQNVVELQSALDGSKLSLPQSHSHWTERLSPGLSEFSSLLGLTGNDDEYDTIVTSEEALDRALAEYLQPLLAFAQTLLEGKVGALHTFPIYLRATGGMRMLPSDDRDAILHGVRRVLSNPIHSPFYFEPSFASVLSGEEEAVFGWAGVNYLMSTLLPDNNRGSVKSYGALDMGGASTQISFTLADGDIISNLFNYHLGGTQNWSIYANSFLYYGLNEAFKRVNHLVWQEHHAARVSTWQDVDVTNPCLPGGSSLQIPLETITPNQMSSLNKTSSDDASRTTNVITISNHDATGNFSQCAGLAQTLLLPDTANNSNCANGECSVAGVYQPSLPTKQNLRNTQSNTQNGHVEFVAFSAYAHVWNMLRLSPRASIRQLRSAASRICHLSLEELQHYCVEHGLQTSAEHQMQICFRASYTFEILHHGYGFELDDTVTVIQEYEGKEVGWALGSVLYEINTLPWKFVDEAESTRSLAENRGPVPFEWVSKFTLSGLVMMVLVAFVGFKRRKYVKKQLCKFDLPI